MLYVRNAYPPSRRHAPLDSMLTPPPSPRRLLATAAAAAAAALALPAAAGAADYVPGEVVVRYERSADRFARAEVQRETGVGRPEVFAPRTRVMKVRDGETVAETLDELRARPEVATAAPNPIARVSAFVPPDPGNSGVPGGWQTLQWNFMAETGVNAPEAWQRLIDVGRPGGQGVVVAVLDTGVAYSNRGRCPRTVGSSRRYVTCRRSPDFRDGDFVRGYDFVSDDPRPNDENGHGTHVAGTVGEGTNDAVAVTGLAYGARIMPVRVLDSLGEGDSVAISAGIRWAARNGADIVNLSFEFGTQVRRSEIPDILAALRYARRKGALVVGASGNAAARSLAYPARAGEVLSVGATTQHGCVAEYSNNGANLDLVAPGGGEDATIAGDPGCRPLEPPGGNIFQMTFEGSPRRFGLPDEYVGTSMAAPHVSAAAALVIASGVIGPDPSPAALESHLKVTARDLGPAGPDARYGMGLLDAARAVGVGVG
jgi:serine protease